MTATEELRCMLDERGVEYRFSECTKVFDWHFNGANGEGDACATEVQGGINILASGITPEQAIAATIGDAGTCDADETETIFCHTYNVHRYDDPDRWAVYHIHVMECTECGHTYEHVNGDYEYCPRCGRKRRDFVE